MPVWSDPEVTVSEIDNDRAGVILSETGVTVPEGQ